MPDDAPDFVKRVTVPLLAGEGDLLPVSAFPVDGSYITGTTKYEKRVIAREIPIWDPELCIDCGKCSLVCPHGVIRMKVYEPALLEGAPPGFRSKDFRSKDLPGHRLTIQVSPDDCTGCGVCVNVCPAKSKTEVRRRAIDMEHAAEHRDDERVNWRFFDSIPPLDRDLLPHGTVKGSQVLEPLFEFSGACAGCGETPYVKLVSQLFGDRIVVANSTGCSSIYGGNLPTTPWTVDREGRGPAWNNSLFEDTAEFGMGMRMGSEARLARARVLLERLAPRLDPAIVQDVVDAPQDTENEVREQRRRVADLVDELRGLGNDDPDVRHLLALADDLVTKGVWIIGGDGWAYDIGFGGLDHVLASSRDVNILVLDTEVYSNTGGQASKATPRGAVAKFAASGKGTAKKDLGALAMAYGTAYVAQIALGANDAQAVKALLEADAWPGPSLVIAYSTCTAHGMDMSRSMEHLKDAVRSGYWPLYRFQPTAAEGGQPFKLDSRAPSMPVRDFVASEARFAILSRTHPERSEHLLELIQADVDERWRYYEQLAAMSRTMRRRGGATATAPTRTRGGRRHEPAGHELPRPRAAQPARGLGEPLHQAPESALRLQESGAAAIVLPSLFEEEVVNEEVELSEALEQGAENFAEALDYFPAVDAFESTADRYLATIGKMKEQLDVPVIASLNATSSGGWVRYAKLIEEAGADALELNLYRLAADPARSGVGDGGERPGGDPAT